MSSHSPQTLLRDEAAKEITSPDTLLLRRLGIESFPDHETRHIPLERLMVPGAEGIARSAKRLVKSIQHVGVLQSPSVVVRDGLALHDENAIFDVIAGRRRVLAARVAGLTVIKCEVYASSTHPLSALLTLIENEQRASAWVHEVEMLRRLLDEKVGLTLDDLASFGFDHNHLHERLKIAQLPPPILTQVLAGKVNREVVRKLIRLTVTQQERVARLVEAGEEITPERVKQVLRAQIDAGLVPLQATLAQGWHRELSPVRALPSQSPSTSSSRPASMLMEVSCPQPAFSATATALPGQTADISSSLQSLLNALLAFEQSSAYQAVSPAIQTLSQAFVQQVRIALRDTLLTQLARQSEEKDEQHSEKGEHNYV